MRDHKGSPPLHQVAERGLHIRLALRVERAGRLVKDQIGAFFRIARAIASRCRSPPLSRTPFSPNRGVVTLRHSQNKVVRQRHLCRIFHARERYIRLPIRDVVANRVVEQDRLLRHLADLRSQRGDRHIPHIVPVDADVFPRSHVKESRDQVHQRALAGAARPHETRSPRHAPPSARCRGEPGGSPPHRDSRTPRPQALCSRRIPCNGSARFLSRTSSCASMNRKISSLAPSAC